jgi:YfiH family protein
MFFWRASEATASLGAWGFTSRDPGTGTAPYDGFNLGLHVGDDPDAVGANRAELAAQLGIPSGRLVFMEQVHGADVAVVDRSSRSAGQADAMVTRTPGLGLVVLVADCVPVLLVDPGAGVYGVAHAGRAGFVAGVIPAVVDAARSLGASSLLAVVGPSICSRCYEVPEAMRTEAAAVSGAAYAVSWKGTPAIDLGAGVVEQLTGMDVPCEWVPGCTREETRLYSHRRTQPTGRFAGVVRLGKPAEEDRP